MDRACSQSARPGSRSDRPRQRGDSGARRHACDGAHVARGRTSDAAKSGEPNTRRAAKVERPDTPDLPDPWLHQLLDTTIVELQALAHTGSGGYWYIVAQWCNTPAFA